MIAWLQESVTAAFSPWAASLDAGMGIRALGALGLVLFGWMAARGVAAALSRALQRRLSAQSTMVARLGGYYAVLGVAVTAALGLLGVDLSVLIGAAGVLTVALGFAAQTATSNLISGLFLLGEQPFVVGDVIQVGGTMGEVVEIDLMSVKLRTFNNLLVRVPNETILKSEIQNLTRFPIRRFDLEVVVPHDVSMEHVRDLLVDVADAHPVCLDEPRPAVWFVAFEDAGIRLRCSIWSATSTFLALQQTLPFAIQRAFLERGIAVFGMPRRLLQWTEPDEGPA